MLTAQYINQFGDFKGYCDILGGYLYMVGDKEYLWNGKGVTRINK